MKINAFQSVAGMSISGHVVIDASALVDSELNRKRLATWIEESVVPRFLRQGSLDIRGPIQIADVLGVGT